jgi:uncharacterized membrane protein YeaQ/YmgE (transglycosylase-associated protein family)
MPFLLWNIVGLFAGWMTGKNMRGYGYGPLIDITMGIAGGVAGGFIMRSASFPGHALILSTTLAAILGAILLTAFVGVVSGKRRYA